MILAACPLSAAEQAAAGGWSGHPLLEAFGLDGRGLPTELYLVRGGPAMEPGSDLVVHGSRRDVRVVSGPRDAVFALNRAGCLVMELPRTVPEPQPVAREWARVETPDPGIAAMVAQVEWSGIEQKIQALVDHGTRYTHAENHQEVAESLADRFAAFGLAARTIPYHYAEGEFWNVEATQPGTLYPDSYVVICAHFDSISEDPFVSAPGADDNATGVAAVLTAAEILSQFEFEYSIRYVCFSGEEQGLVGSYFYMYEERLKNTDFVGALNFDMLGYWAPGVEKDLEIETNHASLWLAQAVLNAADLYTDAVYELHIDDEAWWGDHYRFWLAGYPAVNHEESWDWYDPDFNPYYHSTADLPEFVDPGFTTDNVRLAVAALATVSSAEPPVPAAFELRPDSELDPFNPRNGGILNAVIPGTGDLDVRDIIPSSLRLEGSVLPFKGHIVDLYTPAGENNHACIGAEPDGREDLWLAFQSEDVAGLIEAVDGEAEMSIRARLADGTVIRGSDVLLVLGGDGPEAAGKSTPGVATASRVVLHQNAPNPFNPSTTIRLDVPAGTGPFDLRIYDLTGRLVRTLRVGGSGPVAVEWDGRDEAGGPAASGTYLYRVRAGGFEQSRKMVLQK